MIDIRRLNTVGGLTVFGFVMLMSAMTSSPLASTKMRDCPSMIESVALFRKKIAIDEENASAKFYLAVDLDNDGDGELREALYVFATQEKTEASLYELKKVSFAAKKALTFSLKTITKPNYESIVACDVNQDQLLDLVFLGYDHAKSGFENFNSINGTDGLRNLLLQTKEIFVSKKKERREV